MLITYEDIKKNPEINALIDAGNRSLSIRGFTDHGPAHAAVVARSCRNILETLRYDERTCTLAMIAGYMHDIGNAVNRSDHAMSGALLAYDILCRLGMDVREAVEIMTAIGNHDEGTASAVTPLSAALILADKSDVRRSRVKISSEDFDIHDRVNFAVENAELTVRPSDRYIILALRIDTSICAVMDYFEIFLRRMTLCREAADLLKMNFGLMINETRML